MTEHQTEDTVVEEPRITQCGVCCCFVREECLPHHLEWHSNLSNVPDAHEAVDES